MRLRATHDSIERHSDREDRRRGHRLSPEDRRQEFVDKAIEFFAEEGFDGGTRELAKRIGVTQPLIYRYFPSKDDLIFEVYRAVYLRQWQDDWTFNLQDRSIPLRDRLTRFYASYTKAIFTREWMRIFFFAGLKGLDINKRYIEMVRERILLPICMEMRHTLGIASPTPITGEELELVWSMHGGIFYQGIREHVYQIETRIDYALSAANGIEMYLGVAERAVSDAIASAEGRK